MSLYGALYSGVSGLSAQSSAMGAISDNISNVNTTGYKGSKVNFNTLVTKQVSLTNYSPGGVQSKPRAGIDVQGLLQATNSSTDVSLSGQGMFVVNEAANPGNGDMFAYTRAGSFKVDNEGYLQNVSGWYMQGWPLMSWDNSLQASTVTVGNNVYMKGYKDDTGNQVYINDNIVSSTHLQPLNMNNIGGTASQTRNLRMGANLPNGDLVGASHNQPVTIYDSLGGDATVQFNWKKTSQNNWGLEAYPPEGARSMTLKTASASGNSGQVFNSMGRLDFLGLPISGGTLGMNINGTAYTFDTVTGIGSDGATADNFDTSVTSTSTGAFVDSLASDVNTAFQLEYNSVSLDLSGGDAGGSTLAFVIDGVPQPFTTDALDTTAADIADTLNENADFTGLGLRAFANGTDLHIYSNEAMSFTINTAASTNQFQLGTWSATSKTTDGITYCERLAGTNSLVFRQRDTNSNLVVTGLNSLDLSDGSSATQQGMDETDSSTNNDTDGFTLEMAPNATKSAIVFNGDGTPAEINVSYINIDWANGSIDMNGSDEIGLFLGNTGIKDGMTQLNGDYQLNYWTQNGAKFGNFAGVSIGEDGIVTALFDNGVTRPVFQIPVATFVNVNGMESLTGNVYIATDASGEPTLRGAGSAGSGSVQSAALEASTVDIGTEFTTMIVTQRAYSAAAKIITTADQMLDELVQIKR
ncbi:flagellar hook-basal body complex protein [Magnetospirillum aberrantis]|uniref:Flagellar hook protein FlgE n=1 Tax=Magnetospirillum aberrantis SpK TaxID=908842 RepID=A0A7C9UWE4_9PROT|nr:flagellar hook-basal body complex protein [Magnetospirillum aberrantis]NFV82088.1 flagellar hook-basal body complex protein [Magnetospirillum aberrantis SpK]